MSFDFFMAPIIHGETNVYAVAPPVGPTAGGGGIRPFPKRKLLVQRRKLSPRLLQLIKEWLELELEA